MPRATLLNPEHNVDQAADLTSTGPEAGTTGDAIQKTEGLPAGRVPTDAGGARIVHEAEALSGDSSPSRLLVQRLHDIQSLARVGPEGSVRSGPHLTC